MAQQELLERQKAALNALAVIEPVDPDDDPHRLLPQIERRPAHRPPRCALGEAHGVDPHGKDTERYAPAFIVEAADRCVEVDSQQATQRGGEMAAIPPGVEADQISADHAFHQPLPHRQREEDFRIRKWHMQEKANARVGKHTAKQRRNAEKLIIVHPDDIARVPERGHGVGVALVDVLVHIPPLHPQRQVIDAIVAEGPKHGIGDFLVKD
jgi:hypothetical protein